MAYIFPRLASVFNAWGNNDPYLEPQGGACPMCYGDWDMLGSVGSHLCLPMEVELYEATDRVDSIEHDVDVPCISGVNARLLRCGCRSANFRSASNIIRVLRPVRLITAFEWKVMLDHTNYCHPIMLQLHAMCLAMDTKEDQARQGTVAWCGSAALVSMGYPASHRLSPPSGDADHNAAHRNTEHHLIVHCLAVSLSWAIRMIFCLTYIAKCGAESPYPSKSIYGRPCIYTAFNLLNISPTQTAFAIRHEPLEPARGDLLEMRARSGGRMIVSTLQHADIHPHARESFFLIFGRGIMMQANTKAASAEHGYPAINGERRPHHLQSRPSFRAA